MSVVYICPEFPYPSNTGGKRVFADNINKLIVSGKLCHIFLFNNSIDCLSPEQIAYKEKLLKHSHVLSVTVLEREAANFHDRGLSAFICLIHSLLSPEPRAFYVRKLKFISNVQNVLRTAEEIIVDHAASFGCLPKQYWFDKRTIYISHNIEAKILREQISEQAGIIRKLITVLDWFKMLLAEKKILKDVPRIHFLSNNDMDEAAALTSHRHGEFLYSPFVIPLKTKRWQYGPAMSNLRALFVGGTDYFPNFDAAKWLVEIFSFRFPYVQVELVGKNEELIQYMREKKIERPNVVLHGRVTDEELDSLFLSCSFFISPVILGSGVKIKVLEAASYGIPIFATRESLIGLSFINGVSLIDRESISSGTFLLDNYTSEQYLTIASQCISHSVEIKVV